MLLDNGKWSVVHEYDLSDSTPTLWCIDVPDGCYWISKVSNGTYEVIDTDSHTIIQRGLKTLEEAKSWLEYSLKHWY